jgi:hypothetical protein
MDSMTLPASERHVYGHLRDPEGHRRIGVRHLVGAGSYPRSASLESYLPLEEVSWNQGSTGSCVGWGKSGSVYTSGKGSIVLPSPRGIYKGARWIDRIQNLDGSWPPLTDDGSQPNEADRWMAEYGVVPYDTVLDSPDIAPADLNAEPALEELEKASATLLIGSYSIDTFASDFEAQIARSISSGYAVSFAVPDVDDGFESYTGGTLGAATGKIYGGHELFCFSYEMTDRDFLIRGLNSWGRLPGQWGLLGKFQGGRQFIKRWIDVQAMSVRVAP